MRLLLVGAFPYPFPQGSQVYLQEQAHALREAGAEVELLTYASGRSASPGADRALEGFVRHHPPAWTAPRLLGSGPSWGKPLADLALVMTLRHLIASRSRHDAFDAVLTHNAEACLAASIGLMGVGVPHVYCVHTVLGEELSTYLGRLRSRGLGRLLDRLGRALDRRMARSVDGWIALTHSAQRVMRRSSHCPGELIPPPLADPETDPQRLDPEQTARRHGLEPGRYLLYSGNLDGYQELGILGAAAERLARRGADDGGEPPPTLVLVLASHDPRATQAVAAMPGVVARVVETSAEMQALLAAARGSLLMRRAEGGYPIKLINAHAVGTPTIAFHAREWGLADGESALIASQDPPAEGLAHAITRLVEDDVLATRLRRGARALYLAQHRPELAAARTLALLERILHDCPPPVR